MYWLVNPYRPKIQGFKRTLASQNFEQNFADFLGQNDLNSAKKEGFTNPLLTRYVPSSSPASNSAKPQRRLTIGAESDSRRAEEELGESCLPRRNPQERAFASQEKHCPTPVSTKSCEPAASHQRPPNLRMLEKGVEFKRVMTVLTVLAVLESTLAPPFACPTKCRAKIQP